MCRSYNRDSHRGVFDSRFICGALLQGHPGQSVGPTLS